MAMKLFAGGLSDHSLRFRWSFSSLLEALRIPIEDAISKAPMTISQMATTNVRISIDSRGDPSITMPASRLTKPRKICQPRPGR